jgi:hypothetical protein
LRHRTGRSPDPGNAIVRAARDLAPLCDNRARTIVSVQTLTAQEPNGDL